MMKKPVRYAAAALSVLVMLIAPLKNVKAQVNVYEPVGIETETEVTPSMEAEKETDTAGHEEGTVILKDIRVILMMIMILNGFNCGATVAAAGGVFKNG